MENSNTLEGVCNIKKVILWIGIFLIIGLMLTPTVEAGFIGDAYNWMLDLFGWGEEEFIGKTVEFTPSTLRICNDNKCILTIYSGIRFINEDEEWKKREEARSFKGSGIECKVISDGIHIAKCLDHNETSRTVELSSKIKSFIPLRKYNIEYNKTSKENYRVYDKEFETNLDLNVVNSKENLIIKINSNEILEFGEYSTEIILKDNVTESLEDTQVSFEAPDTNYGAMTNPYIMWFSPANNIHFLYFKFNITSLTGTVIENADLWVDFYAISDANHIVKAWGLENQSWVETGITWNSKPTQWDYPLSTVTLIQDAGGYYNWNITSFVQNEVDASHQNMSIFMNQTNNVSNVANMRSKEAGILIAPYLNITYSIANQVPTIDTPTITPTIATYLSVLNCSTTPYDLDLNTLSVNFTWYNGTTFYEDTVVSGLSNGTLVSDTLTQIQYDNETWNCTIFSNDATDDSSLASVDITIKSRPTHSTPYLSSTNMSLNGTYQNLSCLNQSTADINGDYVKNIYNWYKGGYSIIVLNMPFETNGSETTYVKDYSGLNNTGNVIGATFGSTLGYDGFGAYEFDGLNDYLNIGDNINIGTSDLSLFAWINASINGQSQFIVGKRDVAPTTNKGYEIHIASNEKILATIGDGQRVIVTSSSTVVDSNWHHVGVVFDRDGNGQIYIDGIADGSAVPLVNASDSLDNNEHLLIGAMYNGGSPEFFFNGTIDEVKIYNRTLSAEQVKALYNNQTNLIVSNETSEGETWKCAITPNDNLIDGNRLESSSLFIETINPTVSFVNIDPSSSYTNTTINGTFIVSDINDPTVTIYCNWINGSTVYSTHSKLVSVNTLHNFSLAPAEIQVKGEIWNFSCNATDSSGWSSFNSTTITILNSIPTTPVIADPINETRQIGNLVTLNCAGSTDADGDEIKYEFYGDESTNPPTTLLQNTTDTSYALATVDGGIYWWRCRTNDNEANSGYTQIKQFVENNISIVTNVTILPTTSYTNTTMTGYAGVYDSEDTLTVYMNWTNGTTHYSSCIQTTVASGSTESCVLTANIQYKGETWNFSSRIDDGYELSTFNSTTITITNTPSLIDIPILTPVNVYTNTTIFNCSTTVYDIDLNSLIINFIWWNGTTQFNNTNITTTNGSTESFVVSPSLAQHSGETWNCSVRVFDGEIYSRFESNSTAILNTAPTLPSILIPINNSIISNNVQNLTCGGSTDIDGDELNYAIYGGTDKNLPAFRQNLTISTFTWTGLTQDNHYWRCRANDNLTVSNWTAIRRIINIGSSSFNVSHNASCIGGLTSAMCWDYKDEENLTALSVNIDYNFEIDLVNSSKLRIYGNKDNIDNTCFCVNSSLYNNYSLSYGEIQYEKAGWVDRRYYAFQNTRLTDVRVNDTLFLLLNGKSTSFLFEFVSTALSPYENHYSTLNRWYPDLDTYDTVDMGKTDNKGKTIMHVVSEDVDYRVGLYRTDGTLIKLLDPIRFACLDSPCTYSALITEDPSDYIDFLGVETNGISYSNGVFTLIYNDPSQNTEEMSLKVYKETGTSTLELCTDSSTGYTGILSCNVSIYTGQLRAIAYRTASPEIPIAQKIVNTASTIFKGSTGLFLSLFIFLVLVFIGSLYGPVPTLIFGIIGLIPSVVFGTLTTDIVIGFGTLAGIAIHFMKRSRS